MNQQQITYYTKATFGLPKEPSFKFLSAVRQFLQSNPYIVSMCLQPNYRMISWFGLDVVIRTDNIPFETQNHSNIALAKANEILKELEYKLDMTGITTTTSTSPELPSSNTIPFNEQTVTLITSLQPQQMNAFLNICSSFNEELIQMRKELTEAREQFRKHEAKYDCALKQ